MQEKLKLSKSQGASTPAEKQRMQNIPYASAVGSIMYAVRCSCPDVAFAQNKTSRFQQNPGEERWTAVKNILKYLRNTKDMFLVYGEPTSMYCDNTGAIAIAKDDGVTKGARYFRAKVHYLRETIKLGTSSRLKISFKIVKDSSCSKKVKKDFENVDSSSRVELIPSKIKYVIKVVLSFHKEFSVFSSLSIKENDGLLQDQVFMNKEEVVIKSYLIIRIVPK
nr:retrotransposon protein putative Ty1-copia subclass [Tanacetum cinerariifolium]